MTLFFSPFTVERTTLNGNAHNLGEVKFQSYFSGGYDLNNEGTVTVFYTFDIERYILQVGIISIFYFGIYHILKKRAD